MKLFQPFYSAVVIFGSLLPMVGCTTPHQPDGGQSSPAPPGPAATPFLTRHDYGDRLDGAVDEVLENHRFSIPDVAVRGADSSIWFVTERFDSEQRFDRLFLRVNPDEQVIASITPYQFLFSDWAILGRLFVDSRPEAESIAAQVARRLSNDRISAR
jgi:hypothetical protein